MTDDMAEGDRDDDAGDGPLDAGDEDPVSHPTPPHADESGSNGSDERTTPSGSPRDHPAPEDDDPATESERRLDREVQSLREELDELQGDVEDRTVHRDELESDLRAYVRRRVRRGKARGWGPYLVLLYGTAMTIGAFYYLSGGWAILAMFVVWLSTLGLYTFMVVTGILFSILGLPGRALDLVRSFRS